MPDLPSIAVTGSGRVSRPPDMATLSVGVSLVRRTVDEATSEVAQLATRLIGAVKDTGITDANIQTSRYSVNAEYDHRQTARTLVGYRVNNTVTVTIADVDTIGDVLSTAATAGGEAVTIDNLAFDHSDPATMIVEARALAWTDAEAAARQLAELAGHQLGPAIHIEEGGSRIPGEPPMFRGAGLSEAMAPPIEVGSIERSVNLLVRFEIVPAEGVAS
ncbi:MAG: SIMPL domain-containing protein [Acidimicrobiales bacterium]